METPNLNTLLEGPSRMTRYTDLRLVFDGIENRQLEFDWLVTDSDGWAGYPFFSPLWLGGAELTRLVNEVDRQFAWGVLSGFAPGTSLDVTKLEVAPYADGNPDFWIANPRIQHPQAEIEIVCWDSTLSLLLCRERHRSIVESFRRSFPEAVDLDAYNQGRIASSRSREFS